MDKSLKAYTIKGKRIGEMKSDTTDEVYILSLMDNGNLACNCIGYQTSKRKPKRCKHTRRWKLASILEELIWDMSTSGADTGDEIIKECIKEVEQLFRKEI